MDVGGGVDVNVTGGKGRCSARWASARAAATSFVAASYATTTYVPWGPSTSYATTVRVVVLRLERRGDGVEDIVQVEVRVRAQEQDDRPRKTVHVPWGGRRRGGHGAAVERVGGVFL